MKKVIFLLIAIFLVSIPVACSQPASSPSQVPATTSSTTANPSSPATSSSAAPTANSASGTINIRYALEFPEASSIYQMTCKPVLDQIEKNSNGRITFTKYLGGILGTGPQGYDMVQSGKADLTLFATGYAPGRFPMSDVFSIPGAFADTADSEAAALAVYDHILYKEYTDVKSLSYHHAQLFWIYTVKKPVKTLDDLKGMKIRTAGGFVTDALKALGAVPVPVALGDMYTSLETGVVDGAIIGPSGLQAYKLQNIFKYVTKFPFGTSTHVYIMNSNTWAKIPPDLQKVILDAARPQGNYQVAMFQKDDPLMTQALIDNGGASYTLPPEEAQKWIDAIKPIVANWVSGLNAKGLPGNELMKIVREETSKRNVPFPY